MSTDVTLKPRTARSKLSRKDPAPKSSALLPTGNVAITFEKVDHRYSMPRVLHPSILETSSTRSNVLVRFIGLATNSFTIARIQKEQFSLISASRRFQSHKISVRKFRRDS